MTIWLELRQQFGRGGGGAGSAGEPSRLPLQHWRCPMQPSTLMHIIMASLMHNYAPSILKLQCFAP